MTYAAQMLQLLALSGLVVVSSGLCSGAEAALLSVSELRVRQLAETGGAGARTLLSQKERPTRPIAAIVVLNNIANIVGSMAVGSTAATLLGSTLLGVFTATLTLAIIVFAEILPKSIGSRYAERIALLQARPLAALVWSITPLLVVLERITSAFGGHKIGPITNEDQIRFLVRAGGDEGSIDRDESELIQKVFQLDDLCARDILTPRTRMTWIRAGESLADAAVAIRDSQHSRIVVVGDTLDDVVGVALQRDLLLGLLITPTDRIDADWARLQPPQFVPPGMKADELLPLFRSARRLIAVVRDEYGAVHGVVTLEDVLEILTGEIVDETDRDVDLREAARRTRKN
ncbi:MAG: CBS domain containing-hemolysin-like protein [Myxococcota bacterium]